MYCTAGSLVSSGMYEINGKQPQQQARKSPDTDTLVKASNPCSPVLISVFPHLARRHDFLIRMSWYLPRYQPIMRQWSRRIGKGVKQLSGRIYPSGYKSMNRQCYPKPAPSFARIAAAVTYLKLNLGYRHGSHFITFCIHSNSLLLKRAVYETMPQKP